MLRPSRPLALQPIGIGPRQQLLRTMFQISSLQRALMLCTFALLNVGQVGCALDRWPRIDPSGQRLLIFPDDPAPIATVTPGTVLPTTPPGELAAGPGNQVAPPVYSDTAPALGAGSPSLGAGSTVTHDWLGRPTVIGPPVAGQPVAGQPGVPVTAGIPAPTAAVAGDQLSITPSRVLAPVGSEVVLKAGICATSGYLLTNRRIEWLLDRNGAGQILTVGNQGELDMFRAFRDTPRKIDNHFAIGATSPFRQNVDRGTPAPNDDVCIRRGETWLTVTSASEGTSYITAYAPDIENWQGRTAAATIYWIDAQWAFPPSVTLPPGQSHTLTTTVTRQSDGAPVAGWIVRYRVEGGSAALGYEGGQTSEVSTNNQGQASVEIAPTDARPGSTRLAIEIIRPEQAGIAASPRVTLGTGSSTITWGTGVVTPPPTTTSPLPFPPSPSLPPTTGGVRPQPQPEPFNPPANTPPVPTGRPDLFVQIERLTNGPFYVGEEVEYVVKVINQGDGLARGVRVVDEFDPGLETDIAAPGEQFFRSDPPFDLSSGESWASPPIRFRLTRAGRLSHNVTVTAENAVTANERAFLTVEQSTPAAAPSLEVTLVGPERHTVGEVADFRIVVDNLGASTVRNVIISSDRDPELRPTDAVEGYDPQLFQSEGTLQWSLAELQPSGRAEFRFRCECVAAAQNACARLQVAAEGLTIPLVDQKCIEIRPLRSGSGSSSNGDRDLGSSPPQLQPPPLAASQGLELVLTETAAPRVGTRFVLFANLTNVAGGPLRNVQARLLIPAEFQFNPTQVETAMPVKVNTWADGRVELSFGPVEMPAGERYSVAIPMTALQEANVQVWGQTSAEGLEPQDISREIRILPRS